MIKIVLSALHLYILVHPSLKSSHSGAVLLHYSLVKISIIDILTCYN